MLNLLLSVLGIGAVAGLGFLIIRKIVESRRIYNFHDELGGD